MSGIVQINNAKSELATTMRDSIRMRSISLRNMLATQDVFLRDEEMMLFRHYAALFAEAREQLNHLLTEPEEISVQKKLIYAIRIAKPLNQRASEYVIEDQLDTETGQAVINNAFVAQQDVLFFLDNLVALQKKYSSHSLQKLNDQYAAVKNTLLVVVFFVVIIVLFISYLMGRFVTRNNQKLQLATNTKSIFLANMSHEIRTPLTAIIGFTKLLLAKKINIKEQDSTLETIVKNSEHLLLIINDILDISKIEANQLELDINEFSLFDFIYDVKSMLEGAAVNKGIKLSVNFGFPLPLNIQSDEVRLKQILVNLCSNAIKFTEEGSVIIDVYYNARTKHIGFSVSDTGIGLAESQCDKIFSPFVQAESSTTRKFGGTGLGLSISRQLVNKLGGELSVTSTFGKGSCFRFFVDPGEMNEAKFCSVIPNHVERKNIEFETYDKIKVKGHVLLVEDSIDSQKLISTYLEDFGAEVIVAENGQIAVDLVSNNTFDLILMDMQMPVMGGLEAVKIIRHKKYSKPIAMLTANALKEEKEMCFQAGCNDFLIKPIDINELCRVISEYLPVNDIVVRTKEKCNDSSRNTGAVISSLSGKSEKYDELIFRFVNNLPEFIHNIENAYLTENFKELASTVHNLKGVGGNYGFLIITEICREIEVCIEQDQLKNIETLIDELKITVGSINAGLEANKTA